MDNQLILLDTHVHTSQVSICGKISADQMVRLYKKAGYQAIIITDHYCKEYFDDLGNIPWQEKIEYFLSGYKLALSEGNNIGIKVFLGLEIRFTNGPEDYLVYGLDEDYLIENPKLYNDTLTSFRARISQRDALIIQAHPFRKTLTPASPELLDGVEIYNGNPRHDSKNEMAYAYARDNNLKMIAGSDAHQIEDIGKAGIWIPSYIDSMDKFIEWYGHKLEGTKHSYINDKDQTKGVLSV